MDATPTVILDHNIYYSPSGPKAVNWTDDQKDFSTFEEYVLATGNDQNSRFADPRFVDTASNSFHLEPDSPARNGGDNLGIPIVGDQDLDGRPRLKGTNIDIGCYETLAPGNVNKQSSGSR